MPTLYKLSAQDRLAFEAKLETLRAAHTTGKVMYLLQDVDGSVLVVGQTDEARGGDGKLHYHEYQLRVTQASDGTLRFVGGTTSTSNGPEHDHDIDETNSDSSRTEYEFDTKEGGADNHPHFTRIELEQSFDDMVAAEDDEDPLDDTDDSALSCRCKQATCSCGGRRASSPQIVVKHKFRGTWKRRLKALRSVHRGKLEKPKEPGCHLAADGATWTCYRQFLDPRRVNAQASMNFSAPLFELQFIDEVSPLTGPDEEQIASLFTEEGLLPQEITRTGEFRHPWYGNFGYNREDLEETMDNFERGVTGQDVLQNANHFREYTLSHLRGMELVHKPYHVVDDRNQRIRMDGFALLGMTRLTPRGFREMILELMWPYNSIEHARKFRQRERIEGFTVKRDKDGNEEDDDFMTNMFGPVTHENVIVGFGAVMNPFQPNLDPLGTRRRFQNSQSEEAALSGLSRSDLVLYMEEAVLEELRLRGISMEALVA